MYAALGEIPEDLKAILNFTAIDIETTGLDAGRDEIIEIAAIRYEKGIETKSFDVFVKPKKGMPKYIQYLTHIDPEELKKAPNIAQVLPELRSFIGNSILVGHNIPFDLGFINENLIRIKDFPLINQAWDTAELARIYFPFTNDHKLSSMVDFFDIPLVNAHRADADARATGLLLVQIAHYITKHFGLELNARLHAISLQAQSDSSLSAFLEMITGFQRRNALILPKPVLPPNPMHNVIEHDVPFRQVDLNGIFGNGGLFDQKFENYEERPGQIDMAHRVQKAMQQDEFLVVEAGTGVGKSFAYLVPAISYSLASQGKVVVSTNTKNLQEQLFYKDLPLLKDILPMSFRAVLVKGRENYICKRRYAEFLYEQSKGISPYDARALLNLLVWMEQTHTGDVSENSSFDKSRYSISWRKICSDRYLCHNRKCQYYNTCSVMSLRKHIEKASVVVVNHSLLLADLKSENTTLGAYTHLVVDEAHNLMASAAKHLGFDISYAEPSGLLNQLTSTHKRKSTGFLHLLQNTLAKSLITDAAKSQVTDLCNVLQKISDELRTPITDMFNLGSAMVSASDSYGKLRIKDPKAYPDLFAKLNSILLLWKTLLKELRALSNVLSTLKAKQINNYDVLAETLGAFEMRAFETEGQLLTLANPDLEEYALWVESNQSSDRNFPSSVLCYAPIEVNKQLNTLLYKNVPCIVFTSATMAIRGSFKYFLGQSGLNLLQNKIITDAIVDSPFDYEKQSRLMIASFLPEHKDKFFLPQALGCLEQVIMTSNVGTMLLFTSYKDLNVVYEHLGDTLYHNNRAFYAQGKGGSRSSILKEFKKNKNGVLLGTSSFWEGVDVQGESLSLLILHKLPFLVPSEPIVEAYIDKLERENRDSFMHYMLPNALLKLRQGFGRLIRSKSDSGVVLIMDSRVSKKQYGQYFKQVLPTKCIELKSELDLVSQVSSFFNRI